MTPNEIALLTAAKLEHDGIELTANELREMVRLVRAGAARRDRFRGRMQTPAYQWKKPAPRR